MAPANRKALGARSAGEKIHRKGLPNLAEMAQFFATEDVAVQYLLARNVITIPNCTTCGRPGLRKAGTWTYRCQKHKFFESLVSSLDLINITHLGLLTDLTSFESLLDLFFPSANLGFT